MARRRGEESRRETSFSSCEWPHTETSWWAPVHTSCLVCLLWGFCSSQTWQGCWSLNHVTPSCHPDDAWWVLGKSRGGGRSLFLSQAWDQTRRFWRPWEESLFPSFPTCRLTVRSSDGAWGQAHLQKDLGREDDLGTFIFPGVRGWAQGLVHTRQALYLVVSPASQPSLFFLQSQMLCGIDYFAWN